MSLRNCPDMREVNVLVLFSQRIERLGVTEQQPNIGDASHDISTDGITRQIEAYGLPPVHKPGRFRLHTEVSGWVFRWGCGAVVGCWVGWVVSGSGSRNLSERGKDLQNLRTCVAAIFFK